MSILPDPIDVDDPAHLPLIYENWRALNGGATDPDCEEAIALGMTPREHFHTYLWSRRSGG